MPRAAGRRRKPRGAVFGEGLQSLRARPDLSANDFRAARQRVRSRSTTERGAARRAAHGASRCADRQAAGNGSGRRGVGARARWHKPAIRAIAARARRHPHDDAGIAMSVRMAGGSRQSHVGWRHPLAVAQESPRMYPGNRLPPATIGTRPQRRRRRIARRAPWRMRAAQRRSRSASARGSA